MKYHYKSPAEIRDSAEARGETSRLKRNRGNLILFADLLVIFLILAGIYYSGILRPARYVSDASYTRSQFEYTGSLELPENIGSSIGLYLNVRNTAGNAREFPVSGDGPTRVRLIIEPTDDSARISMPIALETRRLRAGETTVYREKLVLPPGTPSFAKGAARLKLAFADGESQSLVF